MPNITATKYDSPFDNRHLGPQSQDPQVDTCPWGNPHMHVMSQGPIYLMIMILELTWGSGLEITSLV